MRTRRGPERYLTESRNSVGLIMPIYMAGSIGFISYIPWLICIIKASREGLLGNWCCGGGRGGGGPRGVGVASGSGGGGGGGSEGSVNAAASGKLSSLASPVLNSSMQDRRSRKHVHPRPQKGSAAEAQQRIQELEEQVRTLQEAEQPKAEPNPMVDPSQAKSSTFSPRAQLSDKLAEVEFASTSEAIVDLLRDVAKLASADASIRTAECKKEVIAAFQAKKKEQPDLWTRDVAAEFGATLK